MWNIYFEKEKKSNHKIEAEVIGGTILKKKSIPVINIYKGSNDCLVIYFPHSDKILKLKNITKDLFLYKNNTDKMIVIEFEFNNKF